MMLQHRRQLLKFWDMALHLAATKVVLAGLDAWRILLNYLLACVLRGLNHDWSSMMQLRGLVFEPVT